MQCMPDVMMAEPKERTLGEMMAELRAGAAAYQAEMAAIKSAITAASAERDAIVREVHGLISDVDSMRAAKDATQAEVKQLEGELRRAELATHTALMETSISSVVVAAGGSAQDGAVATPVLQQHAQGQVDSAAQQLRQGGHFVLDAALPGELAARVRQYVLDLYGEGRLARGRMRGGRTGNGETTEDRERRGDLMLYVSQADCPRTLDGFFAFADGLVSGLAQQDPCLVNMTIGAWLGWGRVLIFPSQPDQLRLHVAFCC